MSGVVDVGDAITLTFNTAPGATVVVSWLDPYQTPVIDQGAVSEIPADSGTFPYTLLVTTPGMWTAVFTASGTATAVERYYVRATNPSGPPPLAAVGDVTGQTGNLTAEQEQLAGYLLRAASKMVRGAHPQVDAHISGGRLDPDVVALAVANMVVRVLRNPRGLRAQATGPFSLTYDTTLAAGQLIIGPAEESMLTPSVEQATNVVAVGTVWLRPGLQPGLVRPGLPAAAQPPFLDPSMVPALGDAEDVGDRYVAPPWSGCV